MLVKLRTINCVEEDHSTNDTRDLVLKAPENGRTKNREYHEQLIPSTCLLLFAISTQASPSTPKLHGQQLDYVRTPTSRDAHRNYS